GLHADAAQRLLARNFHAAPALVVNQTVIAAFNRIAAEPSRRERQPPMGAMVSERHGLARLGAKEDDVLVKNSAAKWNASDLVAPGADIPLITQEHGLPPSLRTRFRSEPRIDNPPGLEGARVIMNVDDRR